MNAYFRITHIFIVSCVILAVILSAFPRLYWETHAQENSGPTAEEIKQEIRDREAEIQKLREELAQYQREASSAASETRTLNAHITGLNREISALNLDLKITTNRISSADLSIYELSLNIDQKNTDLERMKRYIGETMQALYRNSAENPFYILLKNSSFSDFLNHSHFAANLQSELVKGAENLRILRAAIEEEKGKLESTKTELENHKLSLQDKEEIAAIKKGEKAELLRQTRSTEAKYRALAEETKKRQEDVQKEIFELEDNLRYALDPSSLPPSRSGLLQKPAAGVYTQLYGNPAASTRKYYDFHNGVDIANATGTPIYAAMEGTVIASEEAPYAYGKWVVIDHHNGLSTLYGHMSLKKVSVGQQVKRGQLIGYMGSTGISTGPHVHFTVYATNTFLTKKSLYSGILPIGATVDPMKYL